MPNFATQTQSSLRTARKKEQKKKNGPGKAQTKRIPYAVGTVNRSREMGIKTRNSNVVITNEELVQTVSMVSSPAFLDGLDSVPVQAGSSFCFPWLSQLALNFQSYAFRKLVFHYRPSCPTTTAGVVALGFDPDPSNALPQSLSSLSALRERVTGSAWTALSLSIPPKVMSALGGRKLVRSDTDPVTNSSRPQFDCGNLLIYAGSGTALPLSGLLYVSYSVELFVPQPPEGGSASVASFTGASPTIATPFGLVPERSGSLFISCRSYASTGVTPESTEFTFPRAGRYLLSAAVSKVAGTFADTTYVWASLVGVTVTSNWSGANVDGESFISRAVVSAVGQGSQISFRALTVSTASVVKAAVTIVFCSDSTSLPY